MKKMQNNQFKAGHRSVSIKSFAVAAFTTICFSSASSAHEGFGSLVEELIPSVVSITVEVEQASQETNLPTDMQEFMNRFFRDRFQDEGNPQGWIQRNRPQTIESAGSGFFISEDGYIVTNDHVVNKAKLIKVQLYDDQIFEAEVVGTDPKTDIAVIKIDTGQMATTALEFGDSDIMRVGDQVLAIGNPFGLEFSVSAGIVSGRNRTLSGGFDDYIQTDAAINSGNSGGPLLNLDGEVIGVNTLYLTNNGRSGGSSGIGFSMASAVVEKVVDQLIEYGSTRRGWLGISMQNIDSNLADAIGLESAEGTLVVDLLDGPAKESGIKIGDVITKIDGTKISNNRDLLLSIASAGNGTEVEITLFRNGETIDLSVVLASREEFESNSVVPASRSTQEPMQYKHFGLTLGELNDDLRERLQLENGIVVLDVENESTADKQGIRQGDIILKVDNQTLSDIEGMSNAIEEAEDEGRIAVLLYVNRDGTMQFIALPVGS